MRNAAIRLGLLALAALVLGGAWWALFREGGAEREPAAQRERLYAVAQDAITSIAVRTPDGEASFLRGADGAWTFDMDPPLPVNPDRWGGVTLLLTGPEVERALDAPSDPGEFGLDAPSAVARVGLADGGAVVVRLGNRTPDGRNFYAQVEGRDAVALVNAPWGEAAARLASDPPWPSWFYAVDPERVRVFELERGGRRATFLLGLSETDGEPSARVHAGGAARDLSDAERAAARALAGGPNDLRALAPDAADAAETNLRDPALIVRVSYERASQGDGGLPQGDGRLLEGAVYAIGARLPDGSAYYAATGDADYLLTFDAAWVDAALALADRFGG